MGHIPGSPTVMSVAFPSAVAGIDISAAGFLELSAACRRDAGAQPAAVAGTIDATFERLVGYPGVSVLHREPWVLHFDRFLEPDVADALVKAAGHK